MICSRGSSLLKLLFVETAWNHPLPTPESIVWFRQLRAACQTCALENFKKRVRVAAADRERRNFVLQLIRYASSWPTLQPVETLRAVFAR